MTEDQEDINMKCRKMVRDNLESEGWTILFENKDTKNPVDMKVLKAHYTVLVNISFRLEDGNFPEDQKEMEKQLKERCKENKAWPYKAEIILNKDHTLNKMKFEMLE
ncbi:MAG: hypothetical protein U9R75_06930 [Candidatus Thermoplasmatota archaeon]|nr:hypothetical protein [Candidatus Thermoplasmatota archaeon]